MASRRRSPRRRHQAAEASIWDLSTRAPLVTVRHGDAGDDIGSVELSPDGRRLLTAGRRSARLWDAATGAELLAVRHSEEPHKASVLAARFAPDGTRFATAGVDCTARIWDASTGAEAVRISDRQTVWSVAFAHDGTWLAVGSDGEARIHDADTGEERVTLAVDGTVHGLAVSPDGGLLAAGTAEEAVIFDTESWTRRQSLPISFVAKARLFSSVDFSSDGTRVATMCGYAGTVGASDGVAEVWDVATWAKVAWVRSGYGPAVFSPDGTRLATRDVHDPGVVKVWGIGAAA